MAEQKRVALPSELTAKNGAKALLSGEFNETIEISNPEFCGCGDDDCHACDEEDETILVNVPVSWTTIKEIYAKIVDHFAADQAR
jgi:hypothetical protein